MREKSSSFARTIGRAASSVCKSGASILGCSFFARVNILIDLAKFKNVNEIHKAPKKVAYFLIDKLGFPQLPVSMLFDRAVRFHRSLDTACNMEHGRHGVSGWDGWLPGKRGISDKVGVAITKLA